MPPKAEREIGEVRVAFLSDSHGQLQALLGAPAAFADALSHTDLLIHGGDLCNRGTDAALRRDVTWLREAARTLPGGLLIVPGNHDHGLEDSDICLEIGSALLKGQAAEYRGLKLWGGPWTDCGGNWAFDRSPQKLRQAWAAIPTDTDVLITHGAPLCALSRHSRTRRELGDPALSSAVAQLRPAAHLFGHIHEGRVASGAGLPNGHDQIGTTLLSCGSLTHDGAVFQPVWLRFTPTEDALGTRRLGSD